MNGHMDFLYRAGEWTTTLRYGDLPERVVEKIRWQILSVLTGVVTGAATEAGRAVAETVEDWTEEGRSTVLATGDRTSVRNALLANAAQSIALDFDDYLFMGHTGHSAVLTALAVGEEVDATGLELVCAVAAANEVEGRLGASAALGPLNGQMWSFIHGAGAAAAAARLYALEPDDASSALALSLSQPHFPLQAGFMGTEAKVLTAALPAASGVTAARLARSGLKGPMDLMDHPRGFYNRFAFWPLKGMLAGLGTVWLTDTISYKMHPGCAYFMAALDAVEELAKRCAGVKGKKLSELPIRRIVCDVPLLGAAVDRLNRAVRDDALWQSSRYTPVDINFSLTATVALAALSDGLGGPDFLRENLEELSPKLYDLEQRITVRHHWPYTLDILKAIAQAFGGALPLDSLRAGEAVSLLRRARQEFGGSVLRASELPGLASALAARAPSLAWRRLERAVRTRGIGAPSDLTALNTEKLVLPLSARVRVELEDGSVFEAERRIPSGSPGSDGYPHVVEQKVRREVVPLRSKKAVDKMLAAVEALPEIRVRDLGEALAP